MSNTNDETPISGNDNERRVPFQIPDSFFSQLDEFSAGGFIIFLIDEEGNPRIYNKFDTTINAIGLHKFGSDYFSSWELANKAVYKPDPEDD